jgi:hypothetical protein
MCSWNVTILYYFLEQHIPIHANFAVPDKGIILPSNHAICMAHYQNG